MKAADRRGTGDRTEAPDDVPRRFRALGFLDGHRPLSRSPARRTLAKNRVDGRAAASRSTWAPRFSSGSFNANSLAIVTPLFQTSGCPISSSIDTARSGAEQESLRTLQPQRTSIPWEREPTGAGKLPAMRTFPRDNEKWLPRQRRLPRQTPRCGPDERYVDCPSLVSSRSRQQHVPE
jgi:hypothetical protein